MRLTHIVLASLLTVPVVLNAEQLYPQVKEISDKRSTGHFTGLDIELSVITEAVADASGYRFELEEARDNTGKALTVPEGIFGAKGFQEINSFYRRGNALTFTVKLTNPPRRAAVVESLKGELVLHLPQNDADSVLTLPLAENLGAPIEMPVLADNAIELTFYDQAAYEAQKEAAKQEEPAVDDKDPKAMVDALGAALVGAFQGLFSMQVGPNDIGIRLSDPQEKIVKIGFYNAAGEEIDSNGSMSSQDEKVYGFNRQLPADAVFKIFVATDKSTQRYPISMTNIALP